MRKLSITLEIPNSAKEAIPSIMKDLGIAGTEYSTKPTERVMLWGEALDVVEKIMSKLKSKGYSVKKLSKKEVNMPGLDGTGPFGEGHGTGMEMGKEFLCPQCGFGIRLRGGMEDTNGWHGIRPKFVPHRRGDEEDEDEIKEKEKNEKEAQDTTFPVILKHNRVRVPELKAREIGTVEKVYLDGSLDILFPSDGEETVFVDIKGKYSVQKVGLNVGDKFSNGIEIKALHTNKEVGVYAATIQYEDGQKKL